MGQIHALYYISYLKNTISQIMTKRKCRKEVVTRIYSLLLKQVTPIFPGKIDWPNNSCFYAQVYIKCISKYAMYPLKFPCIKSHLWTLPFHGEFSRFLRLTKNTSALKWWRRYYDAAVKTERTIYIHVITLGNVVT